MIKKQKKQSSVLVKIYILVLFICGIFLGLSYVSGDKSSVKRPSVAVEQKLDNDLVTVLVANGIAQENVVKQYVKEITDKKGVYGSHYKKIILPKGKNPENFEPQFRTLSRNFKIEMSKKVNGENSCEYVFFDKKRIYSTVIFVPKKG